MSCGNSGHCSCGSKPPFPWHRPAARPSVARPAAGQFGACPPGTRAVRVARRGVVARRCLAVAAAGANGKYDSGLAGKGGDLPQGR